MTLAPEFKFSGLTKAWGGGKGRADEGPLTPHPRHNAAPGHRSSAHDGEGVYVNPAQRSGSYTPRATPKDKNRMLARLRGPANEKFQMFANAPKTPAAFRAHLMRDHHIPEDRISGSDIPRNAGKNAGKKRRAMTHVAMDSMHRRLHENFPELFDHQHDRKPESTEDIRTDLEERLGRAKNNWAKWDSEHKSMRKDDGGDHTDSSMVSLDLDPSPIPKYPNGVPEHHITLVFLGKDLDDDKLDEIGQHCENVANGCAPLDGMISGIGTFPASESSDWKTPIWAQPDVPGIQQLADHFRKYNKSQHKEFHPHMTLTYADKEDPMPDPVSPTPVHFTHLSFHRGNQVIRYPFAQPVKKDWDTWDASHKGAGRLPSVSGDEKRLMDVWSRTYRSDPTVGNLRNARERDFATELHARMTGKTTGKATPGVKDAHEFLSTVSHRATPQKAVLHRGMVMTHPQIKKLFPEGGHADLPAASWSTDSDVGRFNAPWKSGQRSVVMHVAKGAKGLDITKMKPSHLNHEQEVVTGGRFNVKKVQHLGGVTHIHLEQKDFSAK